MFSRGDPRGTEGHVGFYLGEDAGGIQILAGNQGDAVSIGIEPKSRLLGFRTPVTAMNSRTMKASTLQMGLLGLDGAAILDSQRQISTISDLLGQIGVSVPAFNITRRQLRTAMRELRRMGYSVHRLRDSDGSHYDNDTDVLIERTDGKPDDEILAEWER